MTSEGFSNKVDWKAQECSESKYHFEQEATESPKHLYSAFGLCWILC